MEAWSRGRPKPRLSEWHRVPDMVQGLGGCLVAEMGSWRLGGKGQVSLCFLRGPALPSDHISPHLTCPLARVLTMPDLLPPQDFGAGRSRFWSACPHSVCVAGSFSPSLRRALASPGGPPTSSARLVAWPSLLVSALLIPRRESLARWLVCCLSHHLWNIIPRSTGPLALI